MSSLNSNESGSTSSMGRRRFMAATGIASVSMWSSSQLSFALGCESDEITTGTGEHTYRVVHQCVQLPSPYSWQTTHNVAVDAENNLYVIHEGREEQKDHPSIFVFDSKGKFIRAFGSQFQGGGHGIEVRKEGSEQFLYVAAYQQVKSFAKLTLKGEVLWVKKAPTESDVYHADEATKPAKVWGRNRFMPTNFAFTNDGGFFLADGYGSFKIHRYDKDGNWIKSFGGEGKGEGTFNTPHGIWIDDRNPASPKLVVTDRAHHTLQIFDIEGNYLQTVAGFGLPANVDRRGDLLLVPELLGRISLLDKDYKTVATLGADVDRIASDKGHAIRKDEKQWLDGKFVHPHDACFDNEGNIYVAEWVHTGRVTKLIKV